MGAEARDVYWASKLFIFDFKKLWDFIITSKFELVYFPEICDNNDGSWVIREISADGALIFDF